jgi:hypothetical protein
MLDSAESDSSDDFESNALRFRLSETQLFSPLYVFQISSLTPSKKEVWRLYLAHVKEEKNVKLNLDTFGLIYLLDNKFVKTNILKKDVLTSTDVHTFKKSFLHKLVTDGDKMAETWDKTYGYHAGVITPAFLNQLFNAAKVDLNAAIVTQAKKQEGDKTKKVYASKAVAKAALNAPRKPRPKKEAAPIPEGLVGKARAKASRSTRRRENIEIVKQQAIPDEEQSELSEDIQFLPEELLREYTLPRSKLWLYYLDRLRIETSIKVNLPIYGIIYLLDKDYVIDKFGTGALTNKDVTAFKKILNEETLIPAPSWEETYGYQAHKIYNDMLYMLNTFYQHQRQVAKRREGKTSHKKQNRKGMATSRKGVAKGTPGKGVAKGTPGKGVAKGISRKGNRKGQVQTVNLSRKAWDRTYGALEEMKKLAPRKAAPHPDETDETPEPEPAEKPKRDYETKGKCLNDEYVEIENPKNEAGEVLAAKACVRKVDENCKTWIRASNDRLVCAPKLEAKNADKQETCEKFKPKIGDYEWRTETYTNSLGKRKTALNCFKKDCAAWQQSKNGNITCSK